MLNLILNKHASLGNCGGHVKRTTGGAGGPPRELRPHGVAVALRRGNLITLLQNGRAIGAFPGPKNKKSLKLQLQGLHPDLLILNPAKRYRLVPLPHAHQAGVLASDPPTLHPFPVSQWFMVDFVPVTAAGPLPISTGFPFELSHLTAN